MLYKGNEVVYVGQSTSIESRITTHRREKDFDSYKYVLCSESLLDETENAFILMFQPKLNKKVFEIKTSINKNKKVKSNKITRFIQTGKVFNEDIDHKIIALHFLDTYKNRRSAITGMLNLKNKWAKNQDSIWIVYVKAYNYDIGLVKEANSK